MTFLKHKMGKSCFVLSIILFLLTPAFALAHRSGCHRWHSCPSDSGSYSCGDAGKPCSYPTYPASGGVIYPPSGQYKDCYDCPWKSIVTSDTRTWKNPLQKGNRGVDVLNLQQALNMDGVYPEAIFNGSYGILTEMAVKKFQMKHHIVNGGSPSTTGYGRVGWATLSKLNELYTLK